MWDFERGAVPDVTSKTVGEDFEISYTLPSRCAEALKRGAADIGIIPAISYATIPRLAILPDAAIAAKGAVRSILLVSKVRIEDVTTIAADTSSRSSVALAQILCRKFWGRVRLFRHYPPDLASMLKDCDAGLLIGDPALRVPCSPAALGRDVPTRDSRADYFVYDLAAEWRKFTGKPFVFAFWAVRLQALSEIRRELDVAAAFRDSRDHGIQPASIAAIARQWSTRVELSEAKIAAYLTKNIYYSLDPENLEGLELFFRYSAESGIINEIPSLRWLGLAAQQFVG